MSIYDTMLQHIRHALAFPQLMCIDSVRIAKDVGGYNADGEIVTITGRGEFDRTGEIVKQVPICIPTATATGAGVYGKTESEQIAVVQYIEGNKAYPIITGYYTDEYMPASDDAATVSVHAGAGTVRIASTAASLFAVLDSVIAAVMQLKTIGGPSNQVISPDTIAALQVQKAQLALVLKE